VLGGNKILEAAKFFIKHSGSSLKGGTVPKLVTEYLGQTEADGRSQYHLRDLRLRLGRFSRMFTEEVANITADEINKWLQELDGSMRTRKNYRETIRTFFHYLQRKGHLARELPTAADDTSVVNVPDSEVSVLTVGELRQLLSLVPERILPTLVLKAFSGVRTEELWRMQWENIDFDQGYIRLSGSVTKTGQKRLVPILPNLKKWLKPYRTKKGKICARWKNSHTLTDAWYVFGQQVGISVGDNKLRHSFISYRVAKTADIAKVASEAGNSVRTIQKNYLELVTPEQAKAWFGIIPKKD
jgi:integrase